MTDAYIFEALRTPIGKGSKSGALRQTKPIELLSQLYKALEQRTAINSKHIEAVTLGCVGQVDDQGSNIAKISTLYHGWGHHIDGATINGFCTSALTAIGMAMAKVQSGIKIDVSQPFPIVLVILGAVFSLRGCAVTVQCILTFRAACTRQFF